MGTTPFEVSERKVVTKGQQLVTINAPETGGTKKVVRLLGKLGAKRHSQGEYLIFGESKFERKEKQACEGE